MSDTLKAPFPWFGGKSSVTGEIWRRFDNPKGYVEAFAGSAAVLLGRPEPGRNEVINDLDGFLANFWRALSTQPDAVLGFATYPVSHVDLGARHKWLMEQRPRMQEFLQDATHPGDAQIAGWWLWGKAVWFGSGFADWFMDGEKNFTLPDLPGQQAFGQIPSLGNPGGILKKSAPEQWLNDLQRRLADVRVVHGTWDRVISKTLMGCDTAFFFDPPYADTEHLYGNAKPVSHMVADWCRENPQEKIALAGHDGEHDLPDWDVFRWSRKTSCFGSKSGTKDSEVIWFSPACLNDNVKPAQGSLF